MRQIATYSGRYVTHMEGTPSIEDIALSLCRTPMFGGYTIDFVSVAHHCLFTAQLMPESKVYGLLHEAYVAVIGSCPEVMQESDFRRFALQLQRALCIEHTLTPPDKIMRTYIKKYDSLSAAVIAHVCGFPKATEFFPMSKDIIRAMEEFRLLYGGFNSLDFLQVDSELQKLFVVQFEQYLHQQLETQAAEIDAPPVT